MPSDQEEEAKLEEQRKAEEAERERKKLKAGIPNPLGVASQLRLENVGDSTGEWKRGAASWTHNT